MILKINLANPRGFCAGVERAINIVNYALKFFGAPIYILNELVHNTYVVNLLKKKGVIFVKKIEDVPNNVILIFSAHGVSQYVYNNAKSKCFKIFDATCPLVQKVHIQVRKYSLLKEECILIGKKGHPEVEGTMGQYIASSSPRTNIYLVQNKKDINMLVLNNIKKIHCVTQTTLSIDDTNQIINSLNKKFPLLKINKHYICYATQNRQTAVKKLAKMCDVVLVVGSPNSSNANRLCEIVENSGTISYLIDSTTQIKFNSIKHFKKIGITAGASAPEILVKQLLTKLNSFFKLEIEEIEESKKEKIIQKNYYLPI